MTLKSIFVETRYILKKAKIECKPVELIEYANDCQIDMVKRLPPADLLNLKKEDALTSITPYTHTVIENSVAFKLPIDYLRFVNIFDSAFLVNANPIDEENARLYQSFSNYYTPSYTNPIYYFSHKSGTDRVICYCPVSGSIILHYYKQATVMTSVDNTPEVDEGVHRLFVPYICFRVTGDTKFYEEYDKKIKDRGGK